MRRNNVGVCNPAEIGADAGVAQVRMGVGIRARKLLQRSVPRRSLFAGILDRCLQKAKTERVLSCSNNISLRRREAEPPISIPDLSKPTLTLVSGIRRSGRGPAGLGVDGSL